MMHATETFEPTSQLDLGAVRDAAAAVTAAHLFVYLAPESADEAAKLGVTERGPRYFAFRSAALGAVPWQVTAATFYNFSPRAVQAMTGVWDYASPQQWQAARFRAVDRAMRRAGVTLSARHIAEARSLLDLVIEAADFAGKPLAAANAAVPLPSDPLLALWQQITVVREWRGDAHLVVLADNNLGPCECTVMQGATGRVPTALLRATRLWNDHEWAAAAASLTAKGWLNTDGTVTETGTAGREQIEIETDQHCAALWAPIGSTGTRRMAELITPIGKAFAADAPF
ncbi:hypothetical protein DFJ75_4705 [Williamsia muralis]|uniref:Uncharacterized protein n=1 Tax=Williamsia marianensis TaxID=85044 RepID=A0A495KB65_WILMA|nr:hypothetical protein [Williamsia muralis]RKR97814.1 hypothetical protein DFJ75_4705 [Williamsia muralis]